MGCVEGCGQHPLRSLSGVTVQQNAEAVEPTVVPSDPTELGELVQTLNARIAELNERGRVLTEDAMTTLAEARQVGQEAREIQSRLHGLIARETTFDRLFAGNLL